MLKPNPTILSAGILLGVLLIGGGWLAIESYRTPPLVVTLMLDADGKPAIEYTGPGIYDFKSKFGVFSLKVETIPGSSEIEAVGEFKQGMGKDYSIYIRSSAVEPFQIELVGFSTNAETKVSLEETAEIIPIPAGGYQTNLGRFYIYYAHPKD